MWRRVLAHGSTRGACVAAGGAACGTAQVAPPTKCEDDLLTKAALIGVGVAGASLAFWIVQNANKEGRSAVPFHQKLQKEFQSSSKGQAVLQKVTYSHPQLIQHAQARTELDRTDLKGATEELKTANFIREMWAQLLSEAFHFPKSFFMVTSEGGGNAVRPGKYKLRIDSLKNNKFALSCGFDKVAEAFDRDHDGTLDFQEFAALVMVMLEFYEETVDSAGHVQLTKKRREKLRSKQDVLRLFFQILDDDGDSKVDRNEFESFVTMMAALGLARNIPKSEYEALWKRYDSNGDGVMSPDEFLIFARNILDVSEFPGEFPSSL